MAQYELNLRDYLRIFRKRRFAILSIFLLIISISVIYLYLQPPVYKSTVTVKIEERKTIAGLLTEWIMYNPGDVMESQAKVITGFPIMRKVALRLNLIKEDTPLEKINEVISQLQSSVHAERIGTTNMIKISATRSNPKEAMDLANITAEVYIEENFLEKAKQARQVRLFIQEQLASLEERIKTAEERLRNLAGLNRGVQMADPIQEKLINLQFELTELMQKYTEKHPRVIRLKEQIKELEEKLSFYHQPDELEYSRLSREAEVNKKLYAMLKEKLEEARINEAQKVGDISIVNPAFMPTGPVSGNRVAKLLIAFMLAILFSFTSAFLMETLDTSISTIEDVEKVSRLKVLGIIPSIGIPQAKKGILTGLKSPRAERYSPEIAQQRYIRLVSHFEPQSPAAESYRSIVTNLNLGPERKTLLVTSSAAREGKSTVATNLAIVLAQSGQKTLLVSTDLRRPSLSKTFGIEKEPGLSEYLSEQASLEKIIKGVTDMMIGTMTLEEIRKTPGLENIFLITSGKLPTHPVRLLNSKQMKELLEILKLRFDCIILDSPPVLPVTDASILSPKVEATVLVYEIGRTSREALLRAKMQLEGVGGKILGIVLNNTQPSSEAVSLYPYYSHYKYKYYTKEKEEPQEKEEG